MATCLCADGEEGIETVSGSRRKQTLPVDGEASENARHCGAVKASGNRVRFFYAEAMENGSNSYPYRHGVVGLESDCSFQTLRDEEAESESLNSSLLFVLVASGIEKRNASDCSSYL